MKKILALLVLILSSCSILEQQVEPTTTWDKAKYTEINGIVEIATAWGSSHLCTASLLSETVILTAAHCALFPAEDLFIVYGCDDIDQESCSRVPVKKIIRNPKWKKELVFADDLAIMISEFPIKSIGFAKISNRKDIPEGLSVKAFGYGKRNGDSGILYSGRERIVRDYDKEMVTFSPGKLDPNHGDSGGPLLIFEDGEWRIVGVLSRARWESTDSSSKGEVFQYTGYAIYTKPIAYREWINEIIYNEECNK